MAMFLKIMHHALTPAEVVANACEEPPYSIYADVVSCHFRRYTKQPDDQSPAGWGEAHVWLREPVKTAEVPGYCEVEKYIELTGDAFLMNEQGRTISSFKHAGLIPPVARSPI